MAAGGGGKGQRWDQKQSPKSPGDGHPGRHLPPPPRRKGVQPTKSLGSLRSAGFRMGDCCPEVMRTQTEGIALRRDITQKGVNPQLRELPFGPFSGNLPSKTLCIQMQGRCSASSKAPRNAEVGNKPKSMAHIAKSCRVRSFLRDGMLRPPGPGAKCASHERQAPSSTRIVAPPFMCTGACMYVCV